MMARGNNTHGFKIRKIRTKAEVQKEGLRRPKDKHSYQLLGREEILGIQKKAMTTLKHQGDAQLLRAHQL